MRIYNNHPSYDDFITNEVRTLEFITNYGLFKYYGDLNNLIYYAYQDYSGRLKRGSLSNFNFHSKFSIEVEGSVHEVLIGAIVATDFSECSYSLAILDTKEPNQLIRKFHFDYAIPSHNPKQKVPSYHLQYGGKMSPKMKEEGLDDSKLDHWLSLPRLNFHPINLALLLDVMLCEFRTLETNKISEDPNWRSLIFANEKMLTCNYYKNAADHISSAAYKKEKLLRDFCYGD